ncbi:MAG: HlyD family efflux transporter periplasmic adaptor subunit [Tannerellaceae bacterium]|jgi:HlyD family secretion protein|nr:HlyD family efflux transporter periplasmic adaptor subunit [Tannerellaceae bacterium]
MKTFLLLLLIILSPLTACRNTRPQPAATGIFEATEIVISSEVAGTITHFPVQEGDYIEAGELVALIDTTQFHLQRQQLLAKKEVLLVGCPDVDAQLAPLREELARHQKEKERTHNLFLGGAATRQQLDEITAQCHITQGKWMAAHSALKKNIASIHKECASLDIQIALLDNQLDKCHIFNPLSGTLLRKYTETHEITAPAKPLYRIADTGKIFLRAYITAGQLAQISLGQQVHVHCDLRTYPGAVAWISQQAEFTPKTIQTQDERANLVYAIKIAVRNDGFLKTGQYGEFSTL